MEKEKLEKKIRKLEKNQKADNKRIGEIINITGKIVDISEKNLELWGNHTDFMKSFIHIFKDTFKLILVCFFTLLFLIFFHEYDEQIINITGNFWDSLSENWQIALFMTFFAFLSVVFAFFLGRKFPPKSANANINHEFNDTRRK